MTAFESLSTSTVDAHLRFLRVILGRGCTVLVSRTKFPNAVVLVAMIPYACLQAEALRDYL